MRELLPRVEMDQILLHRVVHLISTEVNTVVSKDTPTRLDVRKMKAIKWLCIADEHLDDALLYSNTLLRRFVLFDTVASAFIFMQKIRLNMLLQNVDDGAGIENTRMRVPIPPIGL
jgi:hypothetical protein